MSIEKWHFVSDDNSTVKAIHDYFKCVVKRFWTATLRRSFKCVEKDMNHTANSVTSAKSEWTATRLFFFCNGKHRHDTVSTFQWMKFPRWRTTKKLVVRFQCEASDDESRCTQNKERIMQFLNGKKCCTSQIELIFFVVRLPMECCRRRWRYSILFLEDKRRTFFR